MHRELRSLLHNASGSSGFVIAIFLDVRGFSSFARMAESSEAAVFLRCIYTRILDDFFPDADFFKPTGDGLLVILQYDPDTVIEAVNDAVAISLHLVREFSDLCADDPMINFPTPASLGVGLARGAATRLHSGGKTLDYSGRPLNLAARLMDLARPSGVVYDESFGAELIGDDLAEEFASAPVYIKGIAEESPINVWYSAELTKISEFHSKPLAGTTWHIQQEEHVLSKLEERRNFLIRLEQVPRSPSAIELMVRHPKSRNGKRHPTMSTRHDVSAHAEYMDEAGRPYYRVQFEPICTLLREQGVKGTWPVTMTIRYEV